MNSVAQSDSQQITDRVNGQERFTRKFFKHDSFKLSINEYREFKLKPIKTDMIILHATAKGNPAVRHPKTGTSFFIQELCRQLSRRERRTIYQESLTKILPA